MCIVISRTRLLNSSRARTSGVTPLNSTCTPACRRRVDVLSNVVRP
jgi:hypothetical protein